MAISGVQFLSIIVHLLVVVGAQNECLPTTCRDLGPVIRFPFWLKGRQQENCGFPGFGVSCTRNNITEFEFQYPITAATRNIVLPPFSVKVSIQNIDYAKQIISISDINSTSCFPKQLPNVNSSASPFEIVNRYPTGYTLFNCSSYTNRTYPNQGAPIPCLSGQRYQVLALSSYYSVSDFPLPSCKWMYNISSVPPEIFGPHEYSNTQGFTFSVNSNTQVDLHWSEPSCGYCETVGKYCRWKTNSSKNETECYEIPVQVVESRGSSKKIVIAGVFGGLFVLVLVIFALYCIYSFKKKKADQKRIEQYLEDYKALRPTRYMYADIKKITDEFKEKLGQGGYGTVYKGKLSNDILVAVKVLNSFKGNGEEFINEVGTIGRIHHVNVVRLVGYCADGYRRALVYEFLPNDSLAKFVSSGSQGRSLGWEKLQQIAIGIAKGLDYLHQGCNQRILHFDIKPHNILLDHHFNPKVADFGLAKLCSKEQSIVSMTAARGTIGYIAPEVFSRNYGNVSYKADIYSFGMLLLDMVGGRKNFHAAAAEDSSQIYFPEWMFNQLEKGEDIAIQIDKEEDNKIFKILTIVGLWCIQWYPADRPSMKVVIQMLEGDHIPIMPPNPFASTISPATAPFPGSQFNSELESISETE